MIYLLNAFSLNMLDTSVGHTITTAPISLDDARELCDDSRITNAIGHPSTDAVVRDQLGNGDLAPGERMTVNLDRGDRVIVAQYRGPRLPEGVTELPDGAEIVWVIVEIQ